MRLYLSSFDLGDRPEELVGLTGSARRAAIILNALDNRPEGRAVWLKEQTDKLVGLGFSVVELDLRSYFGASDQLIISRCRLTSANSTAATALLILAVCVTTSGWFTSPRAACSALHDESRI